MIYCKDNKELHLSGTADLLLAQATAVAINVLKVACAGRKDEMRKEIVEKFVELVVKDVCGEKSKVSDGNCLIKVENGITTMTEAILKPEKTPAITPGICSGMEATSSA